MKCWVASGAVPFVAVKLMEMGEPLVLGGVPLRIPAIESKESQDGRLSALKVGAGFPVAVTVKVPGCPTRKVAWFALVMVGGVAAAKFATSVRLVDAVKL